MQLINSPVSPFGARILIALRAKGLAIDSVPPPAGGLRSAAFLAVNPLAKIPVLMLDDGTALPESALILDYLEDRFPRPSLRPAGAVERARVNLAVRIMDTYVMAPVIRTFPQLDPARRDTRVVDFEVARWREGLAALAHFVRFPLPAAEAGLSLADCVLPPSLHLCARIARFLGIPDDLLAPHPSLVAYYAAMTDHSVVGPILEELTAAQALKDAKAAQAAH